MVGTPRFDRAEVLAHTARTFAERGYAGASISHLVDATGLLRGSLYGAFGSKAGLFREALRQAVAASPGSAPLVLDLIVVALRERAAHDPAVSETVRSALRALGEAGAQPGELLYARLLDRAGLPGRTATAGAP
ncbi:TetR family transcriptional regulator [Leucobacter massiliensis]|uniref:HTH tetR-type domain-containing protein n=1 Tax=Leucobacter massiliensis TaxID=1686285 RepID=A0A2S9QR28_9MICO|nr:TetR family transcriptional regulator [Leucobacter massiliensis]PRI12040.1 hypothetical protein B4915_02955 [Leucobacter massiliensis]